MRLAPFIVSHSETILVAWEDFARSMSPGKNLSALALRDHAGDILLATVRDMEAGSIAIEASADPLDLAEAQALMLRLDGASEEHAVGRLGDGFDLIQVVSEYRALRASVLSLWHQSSPESHALDVEDLAMFNASIDQSLTTAVRCFSKRLDESRDMFLAILSHDLRSPLSAISMTAQLMPRVRQLDAAMTEEAKNIHRSAKVMAKMISDLLDYTRTRLGAGMPIDRHMMDLGQVATEVVEEARAANPMVDLRLRITGHLTGTWDAARVRQILSNLIGNAIQHGDRTLPIEITVEAGVTSAWAAINNRGEVIPLAEMARIFDPLVRGAGSAVPRAHRPSSIGLGLYIARELVLAHGGTIDVTSTSQDGTTFAFHLPRDARATPHSQPGASLTP